MHSSFEKLVSHLLRTKRLTMTIQDRGTQREIVGYYRGQPMQVERTLFEVRLQGDKGSTQADTFDYSRSGPVDPYPTASETLADLTNFTVYEYSQTPEGFVAWIQGCGWDHHGIGTQAAVEENQRLWEKVGGKGQEPKRMQTLDEILTAWQAEWEAIDRMSQAMGKDVLAMLMEAER